MTEEALPAQGDLCLRFDSCHQFLAESPGAIGTRPNDIVEEN